MDLMHRPMYLIGINHSEISLFFSHLLEGHPGIYDWKRKERGTFRSL
jgi:hypothetical protein